MGLFNFWSRQPQRRTYEDIFLELRDRITEQRLADTEMLDSMHDDAKAHMVLLYGEATSCMNTDPARAQQLMRLALAQGATLTAVVQERYQSSTASLETSFKAIAQAALTAQKALPAAAPQVVDASNGHAHVRSSSGRTPSPAADPTKPRHKDDNFDSDYSPARNGRH